MLQPTFILHVPLPLSTAVTCNEAGQEGQLGVGVGVLVGVGVEVTVGVGVEVRVGVEVGVGVLVGVGVGVEVGGRPHTPEEQISLQQSLWELHEWPSA